MKYFLRSVLIISFTVFWINCLNAQSQFVNPGFEAWEEIGFGPNILEPVNWSSIKSTDDEGLNGRAPVVWSRSDDAHSGNYSLHLYTVNIFGLMVTGAMTNGRIHATPNPDEGYTYTDPDHEQWHTRITSKPDSLVGWYKANPMPGDYAKLKAVVHRGFIAVSEYQDTTDYIGSGNLFLSGDTVDEWTRFSMPITYYLNEEPEFILLTISSSKGTDATEGSELWLDDLQLIYNNGSGIVEEDPDNLDIFAANSHLHVLVTGDQNKTYSLHVYDLSGKLRMENQGRLNEKRSYSYDLHEGIYIVSISYGNKVLTKKIRL
jgi:hypothetical protein